MNRRTHTLISTTFLTCLMTLSLTACSQEPSKGSSAELTVDEIVANHLEAVGGLKAIKNLITRKVDGTLTIAAIGTPWKLTSIQKAPDKKHNRIEIPSRGVVTEGCDGKVAWKKEPGQGIRQLDPEQA